MFSCGAYPAPAIDHDVWCCGLPSSSTKSELLQFESFPIPFENVPEMPPETVPCGRWSWELKRMAVIANAEEDFGKNCVRLPLPKSTYVRVVCQRCALRKFWRTSQGEGGVAAGLLWTQYYVEWWLLRAAREPDRPSQLRWLQKETLCGFYCQHGAWDCAHLRSSCRRSSPRARCTFCVVLVQHVPLFPTHGSDLHETIAGTKQWHQTSGIPRLLLRGSNGCCNV